MVGVCVTCGQTGSVQGHHVGGEANVSDVTVPVCRPCHSVLSRWQLDHGVDLHRHEGRSALDRDRALLVGCSDLAVLNLRRSGEDLPSVGHAGDRMAQATSVVFDLVQEPDRPGRWLPDPIGVRRRGGLQVAPVAAREDSYQAMTQVMAGILEEVAARRIPGEPRWGLLASFTRRADEATATWNQAVADPEVAARLHAAGVHLPPLFDRLVRLLVELALASTGAREADEHAYLAEVGRIAAPLRAFWAVMAALGEGADVSSLRAALGDWADALEAWGDP